MERSAILGGKGADWHEVPILSRLESDGSQTTLSRCILRCGVQRRKRRCLAVRIGVQNGIARSGVCIFYPGKNYADWPAAVDAALAYYNGVRH